MELCAAEITIAITVYNRRDYVLGAIRSALDQTVPVQVIVVEDCGPDPTLRDFIVGEFGDRVKYFRNPKNRGLFDNWHACMEYCQTPWLSILHDDDELRPNFIETILSLAKAAPGRALYFGRQAVLENGKIQSPPPVAWPNRWRDADVAAASDENFMLFPGQLFAIAQARACGGFPINSHFTGDWDMWFRLALKYGAAQSVAEVSVVRSHEGVERGTSLVVRRGWKWTLDNVQRKRNLARLKREKGIVLPFDRAKLLAASPIPLKLLLRHAHGFTRRILFYNWWLFTHSRPPHWRYAVTQWLFRLGGPQALRVCSGLTKIKSKI